MDVYPSDLRNKEMFMIKTLCLSFLLILFTGISLFAQNNDVWETIETVDEFGDKTGDKRLVYQTTGTFSNSATRNSNIDVLLLVDRPDSVSVIVYEYGNYRVNLGEFDSPSERTGCFFSSHNPRENYQNT
jgi:hypothetical protein